MVVIGCGTGRCGTWSLSILLNSQKGYSIGHESIRLPWILSEEGASKACDFFNYMSEGRTAAGDVASWYGPYAEYFIQRVEAKVVYLKRDALQVAASFAKKMKLKKANHWTREDSEHRGDVATHAFDMHFPQYNLPMIPAIEKYCAKYNQLIIDLRDRYKNNVRIYETGDVLNNRETQAELFGFLEIESPVFLPGLVANRHDAIKFEFKLWALDHGM